MNPNICNISNVRAYWNIRVYIHAEHLYIIRHTYTCINSDVPGFYLHIYIYIYIFMYIYIYIYIYICVQALV